MALEDGSGCRNEFYQLNEAAPWANRSDDETDGNIGKQIGEDPIPLTVTRAVLSMATNRDLVFVQGQFVGVINLFPVHLLVYHQMLVIHVTD